MAFYGCLLAEVIPVPIEVPLSRKVGETETRVRNVLFVDLVHVRDVFRMQVSARWASCSEAVASVWR